MQTRDQVYATIVYEQVSKVRAKEPEYKKYGAMAHKLPLLIRTAGLVQALAFVEARGKEIQKRLLADLKTTIEPNDPRTLLVHAQKADLSEYMRLTQQIMSALLWYKRFAQSILEVDASEAALTENEERNG
jgi:CRISPR-associated protein Cmr5